MTYSTRQKSVVGTVLERAKRPLTAREICTEAREGVPGLGIATVYRTIKRFIAEGQVRAVEVPGASPHYERTGRHHHHFFLCQQCRRLFELAGCLSQVKSLAPRGFRVAQHEIVLYGECAGCIAGGNGPKRQNSEEAR